MVSASGQPMKYSTAKMAKQSAKIAAPIFTCRIDGGRRAHLAMRIKWRMFSIFLSYQSFAPLSSSVNRTLPI